MKLCIIDPACHIPTLKILFEESEYFAHEPDNFFSYLTTNHYTKLQNYDAEGFMYDTNWDKINSSNFDILFIVAPLLDYYDPISKELIPYTFNMRDKITKIINSNSFKLVVIFDVYDYDYDPNEINKNWKVDLYFKRNYNKKKKYNSNVVPFPFIMFLKPCVMKIALNTKILNYDKTRKNAVFWAGGLYNHIHALDGIHINRQKIHNEIKDLIHSKNLPYDKFIEHMKTYKICVDLMGVGDPNKRTFEIIANGSLMMSMCVNLEWGFDNNDEFDKDTFFTTSDEFRIKLHKLLTDETHYKKCLNTQNEIVTKYFNKNWLRGYIEKNINNLNLPINNIHSTTH